MYIEWKGYLPWASRASGKPVADRAGLRGDGDTRRGFRFRGRDQHLSFLLLKCFVQSKEYARAYYQKNKERIAARTKAYALANKDKVRAYKQAYKKRRSKEVIRLQERRDKRRPAARYWTGKKSAQTRQILWNLSFDEWCALVLGASCHYCLGPLPETGSALDRKDPQIGYTIENVVPCCWRCNTVKHVHISYPVMLKIGVLLREQDESETALYSKVS